MKLSKPKDLKAQAASLKKILKNDLDQNPNPQPNRNPNAKKHPLARLNNVEANQIKRKFDSTARIFIAEENLKILQKFYEERKKQKDNLGNLYESYNQAGDGFSRFILRLMNARYDVVYLDGRVVIPGYGSGDNSIPDQTRENGVTFLETIGTDDDTNNYYLQTLTLEETALAHLIMPQATSVFIGNGNRDDDWKIQNEFNDSIDVATISYPAACELRNLYTRHYDSLFCVVCTKSQSQPSNSPFASARIAKIKANQALMNSQNQIFGDNNALQLYDQNGNFTGRNLDGDTDFVKIRENFYLHKEAYKNRQKITLKALLLAADAQMAEHNLGTVFNLKGIGLGAFGIRSNNDNLEELTKQALKELLNGELQLNHINHINLINWPSTFNKNKYDEKLFKVEGFDNFRVTQCNINPTSKAKVTDEYGQKATLDIGGTCACGDSGSKFGNEGNRGFQRNSSDDPAVQYSLSNPLILDPRKNTRLKSADCVFVVKGKKLVSLSEANSINAVNTKDEGGLTEYDDMPDLVPLEPINFRKFETKEKTPIHREGGSESSNPKEVVTDPEDSHSEPKSPKKGFSEFTASRKPKDKSKTPGAPLPTKPEMAWKNWDLIENKTLKIKQVPNNSASKPQAHNFLQVSTILLNPSKTIECVFDASESSRGTKLRVAEKVYNGKEDVLKTLADIITIAANKYKIDEGEFKNMVEYAKKNGGFSNKFISDKGVYQKGTDHLEAYLKTEYGEENVQGRIQKWMGFSALIQNLNREAGIYTGRQNSDSKGREIVSVGLRSVFALTLAADRVNFKGDLSQIAKTAKKRIDEIKPLVKDQITPSPHLR